MYNLMHLVQDHKNSIKNGEWDVLAPLIPPLKTRLKDAWSVLLGDSEAFFWPEVTTRYGDKK